VAKSKYEDMVKPRLAEIEIWLRNGLTELQVAHNLGVAKSTFETYKRLYPDFLAVIKKGRRPFLIEIENALAKAALGFEYEETETSIRDEDGKQIRTVKKIKKYNPPHVGACAILLKNKDKENWSDNPQMVDLRRQLLEFEREKFKDGKW
jgi:hypothetical protein